MESITTMQLVRLILSLVALAFSISSLCVVTKNEIELRKNNPWLFKKKEKSSKEDSDETKKSI